MMPGCIFVTRCFLPEDWHHQLRLGIQMGIGAIAYSVIMLTVFRQRVLRIYCIIRPKSRTRIAGRSPHGAMYPLNSFFFSTGLSKHCNSYFRGVAVYLFGGCTRYELSI